MADEQTYTTDEVASIAGASYRMIDYWCRRGFIPCSRPAKGSGSRRRFTTDDVERIILFARAREISMMAGDQLEKLAEFAEVLRKADAWDALVERRPRVLALFESDVPSADPRDGIPDGPALRLAMGDAARRRKTEALLRTVRSLMTMLDDDDSWAVFRQEIADAT